jgi:multicomponent Na+:H+ antiporter subunit G
VITDLANYIAAILIISGGFFAMIGAVGLVRFPDLYTRSHAASKAGTVGSSLAMVAIAFSSDDVGVAVRALAGVVFLLLTAPVAAHLLMRAAYIAGYPMSDKAVLDEMPR